MLNSAEAECYQFVSRSHGEIREHQGFHEAVWSRAASAGFYEPRHCVVSRQEGYIRSNNQFFDSLSLQPPVSINELFQRENQYAMLENDIVTATKQQRLLKARLAEQDESKITELLKLRHFPGLDMPERYTLRCSP